MHRSSARQIDDFEDTAASGRPLLWRPQQHVATLVRALADQAIKRAAAPGCVRRTHRVKSAESRAGKVESQWRGF
jgi:hypothetical protein